MKLRKMLGDINSPVTVAMMRLIETQSQKTLAAWAVKYAKKYYLPIYENRQPNDPTFEIVIKACENYMLDFMPLKELKPHLKTARLRAAEIEDPIGQAAARAIATACAVCTTPTGALGFQFYGAAAMAYYHNGLEADPGVYSALAEKYMQDALDDLRRVAVENEPNPAKINWNC